MQIPIQTLHLFPIVDQKLIELLRMLSPEEWNKPTRAKQWTVKDIASHLLDGNLRTLSFSRDNYEGQQTEPIHSYEDVVRYLNQLNADWVKATKRLSPQVLIDLLETTGREYYNHLKTLDPFQEAVFSVLWAGENKSFNWFHIAREYTEKWHHQQQIREAIGRPGIMTKELYYPLIHTFLQALPHTYRKISGTDNTVVKITITSDLGGDWYLKYSDRQWSLSQNILHPVHAEVSLDPDTAWKLFTKGLRPEDVENAILINGDRKLGLPILTMVAVMA